MRAPWVEAAIFVFFGLLIVLACAGTLASVG
jgi:hypothetical protein